MINDLFSWKEELGEKLIIRVTPKASRNYIKVEYLPDGQKLLRVYVTVPPEDGKANKAVIELLAKELGVAKSSLKITQGLTTRDKVITIQK